MTDERTELAKMTNAELVAYWNVLQMSGKTIQNNEAKAKTERHLPLVDELLSRRGIAHEQGKLINTAAPSNCPYCYGQREFDGRGNAVCHFCGRSTRADL